MYTPLSQLERRKEADNGNKLIMEVVTLNQIFKFTVKLISKKTKNKNNKKKPDKLKIIFANFNVKILTLSRL